MISLRVLLLGPSALSRHVTAYITVSLLLLWSYPQNSSAVITRIIKCITFWDDDCNLPPSGSSENVHIDKLFQVDTIVTYLKRVIENAKAYENDVAKVTLDYPTLEALLVEYVDYDWIKEFFTHVFGVPFNEAVLPKSKLYGHNVADEDITQIVDGNKLKEILPDIYKTMKMVIATFEKLIEAYSDPSNDDDYLAFPGKMETIKKEMTEVLCPLHLLAWDTKNLENMPIRMDQIDFSFRKHEQALLVFRDSINFAEYVLQIFEKLEGKSF